MHLITVRYLLKRKIYEICHYVILSVFLLLCLRCRHSYQHPVLNRLIVFAVQLSYHVPDHRNLKGNVTSVRSFDVFTPVWPKFAVLWSMVLRGLKGSLRRVYGTCRLYLHYYHYFVWLCAVHGLIVHEVS
jgi:hypothetical protein